jgi:hypothetical protein
VPAEAVLLTVYALLLLAIAHGLRALGQRSTSPYASRTLAGHVRATGEEPEVRMDDWPHNEVPRLYAAMSLTAALAAIVLCAAGLVLHHEPATITVLLVVITLSTLTVVRLTRALRGLCTPPPPSGSSSSSCRVKQRRSPRP